MTNEWERTDSDRFHPERVQNIFDLLAASFEAVADFVMFEVNALQSEDARIRRSAKGILRHFGIRSAKDVEHFTRIYRQMETIRLT